MIQMFFSLLALLVVVSVLQCLFGPKRTKPVGGGMTIKRIVEETGTPVEQFTCYDCPLSNQCRSAFDPYNTNGDCLEAK